MKTKYDGKRIRWLNTWIKENCNNNCQECLMTFTKYLMNSPKNGKELKRKMPRIDNCQKFFFFSKNWSTPPKGHHCKGPLQQKAAKPKHRRTKGPPHQRAAVPQRTAAPEGRRTRGPPHQRAAASEGRRTGGPPHQLQTNKLKLYVQVSIPNTLRQEIIKKSLRTNYWF